MNVSNIEPHFDAKSVLITGGSGSLGNALVAHFIEHYKLNRLIIFSRDELKQSDMQMKFPIDQYPFLRYFIGDVRDVERLKQAMHGVDLVIHAAALKQVPAAEYNPFECVKTNIMGAENVINAAINRGVKKVIALSTDKAASPINLYGATKLASDKLFIAANHMSGAGGPKFSVVRYGNVVGSRGSVVPIFKRLLEKGQKTLPITDDRMTRFWITLDQGVRFILNSFVRMQGGEIFVPKIPSMKIVDLAKAMSSDCTLETIGIRPGEKLHEVMITKGDSRNTVEYPEYFVIQPNFHWWDDEAFEKITGGDRVQDGFEYSSDANSVWLSPEQLVEMI